MNQPPGEPALEPDRPEAPPPPPPGPIPAEVTDAATRSGLGELRYWQQGRNPFATFGRSMAYSVGWLIGLCALGGLAVKFDWGPLGLVAVPFLAGSIVAAIKAVRNLLVGFIANYLYDNGLVHVKNGRIGVFGWHQVDRLNVAYFAGEMVCYQLVSSDGRKARIELESVDGDPNLGLMVAHKVEALGRPIVATGPSSKRAQR